MDFTKRTLTTEDGTQIDVLMPDMSGYYKHPETGEEYFNGLSIPKMKSVFEKYEDSTHWKNPFRALVAPEDIPYLLEAIPFYHGKDPIDHARVPEGDYKGWALIESLGYW